MLAQHGTGPQVNQQALAETNVDAKIEKARNAIAAGRESERDAAVRKLGYLKSVKKLGLKPEDYVLTKVTVMPPMFRPVSLISNDMPLINDANYLYKDGPAKYRSLESYQFDSGRIGCQILAPSVPNLQRCGI